MQLFQVGKWVERDDLFRKLANMQYGRNDTVLSRGTFSVKGEVLEIWPAFSETAYRIQLFRKKQQVFLMLEGGVSYGPWELEGDGFGLAVENNDIVFSDVTWK